MSELSRNILQVMVICKKLPNSEWRNKVISHLKDALACSNMLSGIDTRFCDENPLERISNTQTANLYGHIQPQNEIENKKEVKNEISF